MSVRRSESGIALMMVIVVLLALTLMAVPLVMIMTFQNRASRSFMADTRARLAVQGIRNWTVGRLSWTNETLEKSGNLNQPYNTPLVDTFGETLVVLDDLQAEVFPQAAVNIRDPFGEIWGVSTEDEQGKIRIDITTDRAVTNLRTLINQQVLPRSRYFTDYSRRQFFRCYPQTVRAIFSNGAILVDDHLFFGDDTIVWLTNGSSGQRSRVVELEPNSTRLVLDPPPNGFQPFETTVFVEQPYPVNMNTADEQVLAAVMMGLSIDPTGAERVSLDEARRIAARIFQRTQGFQGPGDFLPMLSQAVVDGDISLPDATAIAINSLIPTHRQLQGTGTVPFEYRSYDTFTVEAMATINADSGDELARSYIREVVSPAPSSIATWELDSQYDWEYSLNSIYQSQAGLNLQSYPFGSQVRTYPNKTWQGEMPDTTAGTTTNYWEARTGEDNRGTGQFLNTKEHFSSEQEGQELTGSPFSFPVAQAVQMLTG
jgi:hypothetical protein